MHLVLDNYATHKTPEVKAWLEKHPRFKLHFTPTSASWLNLVERFFAEITAKRIRRGSYTSVDDLETAIYDYLLHHNAQAEALRLDQNRRPYPLPRTPRDGKLCPVLGEALDEIRGDR